MRATPTTSYLVLAGGVMLLDRRDDRVVVVVEAGDFVGELGMLMRQPAFLAGVALADSTLLRVRVADLSRLVATSAELGDVMLTAFDARRRMLTRWGEGGLVFAGDDGPDLHRLREFAERNHIPYRTVLRSDPIRLERTRRHVRAPRERGGRGVRTTTRPDATDDS